jgi:hypothetical protein
MMKINAIKLVTVPSQLGHEDTASIADFQKSREPLLVEQRYDMSKTHTLYRAKKKPVIPIGLVNFASFGQHVSRQES